MVHELRNHGRRRHTFRARNGSLFFVTGNALTGLIVTCLNLLDVSSMFSRLERRITCDLEVVAPFQVLGLVKMLQLFAPGGLRVPCSSELVLNFLENLGTGVFTYFIQVVENTVFQPGDPRIRVGFEGCHLLDKILVVDAWLFLVPLLLVVAGKMHHRGEVFSRGEYPRFITQLVKTNRAMYDHLLLDASMVDGDQDELFRLHLISLFFLPLDRLVTCEGRI
jgi:hypothetical protein